ncbi:hypothetical protein HO675_02285 [Streptococcus suis]|nr:hypothetical protein [Streptococcus suis]
MKVKNAIFLASSSLALFTSPLVAADQTSQTLQSVENAAISVTVSSQQTADTVQLSLSGPNDGSLTNLSTRLVSIDGQSIPISFNLDASGLYIAQVSTSQLTASEWLLYATATDQQGQVLSFQPAAISIQLNQLPASSEATSTKTTGTPSTGTSTSIPATSQTTATTSATTPSSSTTTESVSQSASPAITDSESSSAVASASQLRTAAQARVANSTTTSTSTTSTKPSGKLEIVNQDNNAGTFEVKVSSVSSPLGLQKVRIPVWSDTSGQDDIKWYDASKQADGSYKVKVDIANHKNNRGLYHAHLYYLQADNKLVGVGAATTNVEEPKPTGKISISQVDTTVGSFKVTITNAFSPSGIAEVKVPIWSAINGQDDIIWYTAKKQADGSYTTNVKAADHKNSEGTYHVHLYYKQTNGKLVSVAAATTDLTKPKPSASVSIENLDQTKAQFDVVVKNIVSPNGIKSIRVPVWSSENGQDDIIWYPVTDQGNGTYRVTVQAKNHKNSLGTYHAHVYLTPQTGKQVFIGSSSTVLEVQKASGTVTVSSPDPTTGAFKVQVNNLKVPNGVQSVLIPTWTEAKGQDDLVWHQATKATDGSYSVTISPSQHKSEDGKYIIHAYVKNSQGKMEFIGNKTATVKLPVVKTAASVEITNLDHERGQFDVIVSNITIANGLKKVQVPVWSGIGGQDDIKWYEASLQSDGTYLVTVRASQHKHSAGNYHAHVYLTDTINQRTFVGATSIELNYKQQPSRIFIDVSSHNNYLSVEDYQKLSASGVAGVVVKLTEGTSYKNPFAQSQVSNALAAGLKVSVYHYSHFTSASDARAEATYFVEEARRLGLPNTTLMVNDIEEYKTRANINSNMKEWEKRMRELGFTNTIHYTGASWLDKNSLGIVGPIDTSLFGAENFWVAQYPYINGMSPETAIQMSLHSQTAAWQFTSKAKLLPTHSNFDLNLDYSGRFTR